MSWKIIENREGGLPRRGKGRRRGGVETLETWVTRKSVTLYAAGGLNPKMLVENELWAEACIVN
jgi:hypothetical protein